MTSRVTLSLDDRVVPEAALAGRVGRLLLARLALSPHPVARTTLLDDVWPEGPPPAADSTLNATVSRLRAAIGELGLDGRAVLRAGGGAVELRVPADTRVDVHVALGEVDRAEALHRIGDLAGAWAAAVVAQSIARRPLLPGVERLWLDPERDRLHHAHARALAVIADVDLARQRPGSAVNVARELVRVAPLEERSHRRVVQALIATGDRAAAAAAVSTWERILTDELRLPADGRLRSLLETPSTVISSG